MNKWIKQLSILVILIGLFGCGESKEPTTLPEIIEDVANVEPSKAYIAETTQYMHIEFTPNNVYIKKHLLDMKKILPTLLEKYPEVKSFFIGIKVDDMYVLKANFERSTIENLDWDLYQTDELQQFMVDYWLAPGYR